MGQHIGGVVQPLYKTSLINDANLVSYWRLKDNANDYKGTNNGTAVSCSFSPDYGKFGNYGQGASFNGSTSYITLPNAAGINTTFTFSCWVKIDSFEGLGVYSKGSDSSDGWGACVYFADSLINFSVTTTSPSPASYYAEASIPNLNTWYHVAAVFDNTNKKIRLYINGVLMSEASTGSSLRGTDNVYLGALKLGGSSSLYYYLDGNMDDVAIFNRILIADEVLLLATGCQNKELYTTSFINDDNLVAYWRFEGNSYDSKGANNGTDTAITYGTNYGKFGQGASFNGTTSKINFGDPAALRFSTGDVTFSFWIYLTTLTHDHYYYEILNKDPDGSKLYINIETSAGSVPGRIVCNTMGLTSNELLLAGLWYHIVVVRKNGSTFLYINNKLDKQITLANVDISAIGTDFGIGKGNDWSINGYIDDLAIFNRALTAREVKQLYRQTPHSDVVKLNR